MTVGLQPIDDQYPTGRGAGPAPRPRPKVKPWIGDVNRGCH